MPLTSSTRSWEAAGYYALDLFGQLAVGFLLLCLVRPLFALFDYPDIHSPPAFEHVCSLFCLWRTFLYSLLLSGVLALPVLIDNEVETFPMVVFPFSSLIALKRGLFWCPYVIKKWVVSFLTTPCIWAPSLLVGVAKMTRKTSQRTAGHVNGMAVVQI